MIKLLLHSFRPAVFGLLHRSAQTQKNITVYFIILYFHTDNGSGEAHSPSCMKSSVKFPQSVMIWGAMSSAGVGPLCFL